VGGRKDMGMKNMKENLIWIGTFLGMNLYVETNNADRAKLAGQTLARLILREDTNVDREIARMKLEKTA
jgi:hypothetical protein